MVWTVQKLCDSFRDLTPRNALAIISIARGHIDPLDHENHPLLRGCDLKPYRYRDGAGNRIEKKMCAIDHILGTCGVEALEAPEDADVDCCHDYFDGLIALYCNAGDTYATTIAYDVERGRFEITTVGDLVESFEARHAADYSGESFAGADHGGL